MLNNTFTLPECEPSQRYRLVFSVYLSNEEDHEYIDLYHCNMTILDLLSPNAINNLPRPIQNIFDSINEHGGFAIYSPTHYFLLGGICGSSLLVPPPLVLVVCTSRYNNSAPVFVDDKYRLFIPVSRVPNLNRNDLQPISFHHM